MVEKAYPARKTDLPVALGAKPPQSSLLAVRKICALSEERYIQGYGPVYATFAAGCHET